MISGHRNYFYEQKTYYLNEISRITQLYEKVNFKKNKYKKEVKENSQNFEREKERLEKDIQYFREKVFKNLNIIVKNYHFLFSYLKIFYV